MSPLHAPTLGMFCVPTAMEIITGADPDSVIFPALNRGCLGRWTLLEAPAGEHMSNARRALEEMGWRVREYRGKRPLNSLVSTWAKRFPDHTILIAAGGKAAHHCLVLRGGRVYDTLEPHGAPGDVHSFHNTKVRWAAIIDKE